MLKQHDPTLHLSLIHIFWRPQHGGSNGDDGHVGHFEFSPPDLEQRHLLSVRLAQITDAQTQQPQRTRNQFVPAQQETTQPVEVICLSDWFLDRKLAREGGEITIAVSYTHLDVYKRQGLEWAKSHFGDKPMIYVLGNHEFYRHALPELTERLEDEIRGSHIQLLENKAIEFGGFTFLGCTLWTDFALRGNPESSMQTAEDVMNDYRIIRFSPENRVLRARDTVRIHQELSLIHI